MLLSLLPVLADLHVKMKIPTEKILMCVKYKLSFLIQIMCTEMMKCCAVLKYSRHKHLKWYYTKT